MSKFTKDAVAEALNNAIEERGDDYRYRANYAGEEAGPEEGFRVCLYSFKDGRPGCIVGHVISQLDPEAFEAIRAFEYADEDNPSSAGSVYSITTIDAHHETYVHIPDRNVREALRRAQMVQDGGKTWGEAVQAFEQAVA